MYAYNQPFNQHWRWMLGIPRILKRHGAQRGMGMGHRLWLTETRKRRMHTLMVMAILWSLLAGVFQPPARTSAQSPISPASEVVEPATEPVSPTESLEPAPEVVEPVPDLEVVEPAAVLESVLNSQPSALIGPQPTVTNAPLGAISCAVPSERLLLPFITHPQSSVSVENNVPMVSPCQIWLNHGTLTTTLDLNTIVRDSDSDPLTFSIHTAPQQGGATITSSTLIYTPSQELTDTLAYQVDDGRGGVAIGTVQIYWNQPTNQHPLAEDLIITIKPTQTIELDLAVYASDPDGDLITYSIATTPTNGIATLIDSTLNYSPTSTFTQSDTLIYRVTDANGASTDAEIEFSIKPTRLHITPGSVMMTAQGQTRQLSIKAYNAQGDEVSTADLGLEWAVNNPNAVSIVVDPTDQSRATVTSLVPTGSAILTIRSSTDSYIPTAISTVLIAPVRPNVIRIPEEQTVYPLQNPIPNQSLNLPINQQGIPLIGGFSIDELIDHIDVTGSYSDSIPVTAVRFPVIIRGAAPVSGTLVLVGESTPIFGQVLTNTQRGEFTLVQLQKINAEDIFSQISLSYNSKELVNTGFLTRKDLVTEQPVDIIEQYRRQAITSNKNSRCELSKEISGGSLDFSIENLDFDADIEADYSFNHTLYLKLIFHTRAELSVGVEAGFQSQLSLEFECNLRDPYTIELPSRTGWFAILNLVLGPRIDVTPKFIAALEATGGPSVSLKGILTINAQAKAGLIVQNSTPEIIKDFTHTENFTMDGNGIDNLRETIAAQVSINAGVYMVAEGKCVIAGLLLDTVEDMLESLGDFFLPEAVAERWEQILEKIERDLSIEMIEIQAGPKFDITWANTAQVLSEQDTPSRVSFITWTGSGELGDFGKIGEWFGFDVAPFPRTLFEFELLPLNFFEPLKENINAVKPSELAKVGDTVTFEVTPRGIGPQSGAIYQDGSLLTELTLQGQMLRADWVVTEEFCEESRASESGYLELDVVGYNFMPNKGITANFKTPNYLGQLRLSCSDLRIKVNLTPDPTGQPDGISKCRSEDGDAQLEVSIVAVAEDEAGAMTKVTIDSVGPQKVHDNTSDTQKLEVPHSITVSESDPSSFMVIAKVIANDSEGNPTREKETEVPFKINWKECDEEEEDVEEKDTRTRSERCFSIQEQRTRTGVKKQDPDTGEITIEWGNWGPWSEAGRIPTGACTRPARTGGDPHILTQDGLEFDSFSLGEFIYLQPRPGQSGITVQARQERVANMDGIVSFPWTSWNTALAFKAGGTTVEFRAENLTSPLINGQPTLLTPGLHSFGDIDIKVNAPEAVELIYNDNHFLINEVLNFLELRALVVQNGSLSGMLGTPNGEISDDFRLPDGTVARDAFDLANGWRIMERSQSLFTYAPNTGPETYNQVQLNEPPSREELAPFVDQARQLLQDTCVADVLDEVAVYNAALELYTGRDGTELARSGVCWFLVRGTVTNSLVAGLPVPSAKITITSPNLDPCVTYTDRKGGYSCYMPSLGQIPEVTVTVSERGQATATTGFSALPPMNGITAVEQNLEVAPTTLEMTGFVRDGNGDPLYNAELRIKGPHNDGFDKTYAKTDGAGAYKTYLTVDDAVTDGNTTYQLTYNPQWITEPTAKGINVSFQRPLPALQSQSLNQISETLVLTGNVVEFSGRVSYAFDTSKAAVGVRVFIEPTTPIEGWLGCDVITKVYVKVVSDPATQTNDPGKEGTYSCELPLSQSGPFEVRIWVDGQPEQLVQVDPSGRSVGDVIAVVKNLIISTTVLHVSGMVQTPAGEPVIGATVIITGPLQQVLNRPVIAESGIDGRYSAYVGIRAGITNGNLELETRYKDIKTSQNIPFGPVKNGFYYEIPQDITLDGRWLRFHGRVINDYSPETPLQGVVTLSSPGLGTLCSSALDITSTYTCTGRLALSNQQSLPLQYEVRGAWGSASDSFELTTLPALGETQAVLRELTAQPTTLRLQGIVTTPAGQPLAGATVNAIGPGFAETKTASDGSYVMHMPIATTTTTGTLEYSVSFRTSAVTATQAFSATPNQVTTITKDISYGYRLVYFRGQASNDYGIQMPFSKVSIFSGSLDQACTTQTNADGTYFCAAQTNATTPFSVTYVVKGSWGQNSFTEQVNVLAHQDRIEHIADLRLNPTALHLIGTLSDPSGAPLTGVELAVSGAGVYQEARGKTDANGNYNFYVILKTHPTSPFNDVLTYRVGYGTATIVRDVQFTASNNALSEVYQNFTLNARVIQFSGSVVNALALGQPVNGSRVAISSPTLGKLCEYSLLGREHLATYACDAMVFSDQPFAIEYLVAGGWGSTQISDTITTIPPLGQRVNVTRELAVNPTTLRLKGHIVDRDGQPIPGANVAITGAGLDQAVTTKTDLQGNYIGYGLLKSGITTATLDYVVQVTNDTPQQRSTTIIANPNMLSEHTADFYFTSRKFVLKGNVINQTDRSLLLDGKLTIVSPSLDQTLCVTSVSQGAYECTILVHTDDAISLNYRIDAPWGSVTLLNQVAPSGAKTFTANLNAAPRVLHLVGSVNNPTPLANVWLTISSYTILNGQFVSLRQRTDATGAYQSAVVVGDGVLNGDLRYDVELNGNTAYSSASFAFSGTTKLVTVSHDLTLTSRVIHFAGNLDNTLLANQGTWSQTRITIASPTLGKLCETYSQGSYSCSAKVTTDQPFDVVYTAHGDWGSASTTGYVATLPPVGGQSTFRRDINATPTMLRIVGTTKESNGTPKAGVQIMPALPAPFVSSVWQSATSNAQGNYELFVVLKQMTDTTTGTLQLQARYGPTKLTQEVPFSAEVGTLATVNAANFEFNARTVILTGRIINTLVPDVGAAQPKGWIRVLDPSREQYCQQYATTYTCPVTVYSDQPLEVIITVSDEWGSAEQRVLVSDIPESGGTTSVTTNIEVAPTTLHVVGKVVNPNGQPLINADILVKLSSRRDALVGKTDSTGHYSLYALLNSGVTNASLTYNITFDGILSTFVFKNISFGTNQLYSRHEDFTFEKRRVRFTGNVTNQFVPNLPVPAQITITSPDFFSERYCDAAVDAQGMYSCDAFIRSSEPFSVNYRLTGGWGTHDVPGMVTSIPDVGGSVVVEKQIQVAPTTLQLAGTVTDGYGKKLANAEVRIGGTGAIRSVVTRTDSNGNYSSHIILNDNVTSGDLTYQIIYYQAQLSQNRHFMGLAENQLTAFPQDFEVAIRELTFTGRVRHQANSSMGLRGRVTISSPNIGVICEVNSNSVGDYTCPKTAITTEAFSATYTVSADWGQQSVTHSVPFGVVGSSSTITQIIEAQPTMLHVSGRVRDQHGTPLSNVRLTVFSPALSQYAGTPVMTTNTQGEYSLYILIKATALSDNLTYQIDFNQTRGAVQVPFEALPNQTTEVIKDITFTSRVITFNGKVVNSHNPAVPVPYTQVVISSAILGDLCTATSNNEGNYSCTLQVLNDEPFSIKYLLSGNWGSSQATGSVEGGGAGSTTIVNKNIAVTPTTLHLHGIVTDANGQPLSNAQVRVSGSNLALEATATTTANGVYDLYVHVKEGSNYETLHYEVTYNATTVTNQPFHRFPRGELTTITRDFTFAIRGFNFSGQIQNAHDPLIPTNGYYATQIKVLAPGIGTLCQTSTGYYSANYGCTAQINVTQPFSIEYHLSGDWGSTIITNSITTLPPIGNTQNVPQNVEIAPTTLRIRGTIRDGMGNPLANARINIQRTSNTSEINPSQIQATTNVSGTYELHVMLDENITSGNLNYTINYSNAQQVGTLPFTATAKQLRTLQQDFTFAERNINFSATIRNSLVPTQTLGAKYLMIKVPEQGILCNLNYYSHYASYGCNANITTTNALSATYTISGDWGSSVFTGTIPAGVVGSSIQVKQDVLGTPTTLHITGKVADSSGTGLPNATVQAQGTLISSGNTASSVTTDANGVYHYYLPIKAGFTSGTINFTARFNGIQTTSSSSVTLVANQLNQATQDFTISQRLVTFTGQIVNAFVPSKTVGSTKVIVHAEGLGKLCEYNYSYGFTNYSCNKQITTTNALSLTYTISGDWGTSTVFGTAPAGGVGSSTTTNTNLAVSPSTLSFTGKATKPDGTPLVSARMRVESPQFSAHTSNGWVYTDAAGNYQLYAVMKAGITSTSIDYRIDYQNSELKQTYVIPFTANQITTINRDFTFTARRLQFSGDIVNALVGWTSYVPSTKVVISAPAIGTLCEYTYYGYAFNNYNCTADITTTNQLSVTYTITGAWGDATIIDQVNGGTIGSSTSVAKNLAVSPTTLHLTGLTLGAGAPLPGTVVSVSSYAQVANQSNTSAADGGYEMLVVLNKNTTSGTLNYSVRKGSITQYEYYAFSATPNQLTAISRDFDLNGRQLSFNGSIINSLIPTTTVAIKRVEIHHVGGEQLCSYTAYSSSSYSCTTIMTHTNGLDVRYVVSGDWGTETFTHTVPAGAIGDSTAINRNLAVKPTTLHLSGKITKPDGSVAANAYIRVESPQFNTGTSFTASTDATGSYHLYPIIAKDQSSLTFTYTINLNSASMPVVQTIPVTPNQLTNYSKDFVFNVRTVSFDGNIINAFSPNKTYVESSQITITAPHLGHLCTFKPNYLVDYYWCSVPVTDTAAFSVTYSVTGPWGTEALSGTVAAGIIGSSTYPDFDLRVHPTTIMLQGQITDGINPLQWAYIYGKGSAFIGQRSTSTNQQGQYNLYMVLKQGVVSGTLEYEARYNNLIRTAQIPFTAEPNQLVTLPTRNEIFNERKLTFSGSIKNFHAPTQSVGATRVQVQTPQYGTLCEWNVTNPSSAYSCTRTVTNTQPLSLTYAVSGPWGSSVITGPVVTTFPNIGNSATTNYTLQVPATTLHFHGTLTDPSGAPLPYASVYVDAPALFGSTSPYASTDANGVYHGYGVVNSGAISGSLTYRAYYGNGSISVTGATVTITAPNQVQNVERNLLFTARRVTFQGVVNNALVPDSPVYARQITISSPGLGTLCTTASRPSQNFTYLCYANVQTTEAITVEYAVSGGWGTTLVTDTVAAGGINTTTLLPKTIVVTPTTLQISGTLTMPDGAPLANASIRFGGPDVLYPLTAQTTTQGVYTLNLPVNDVVTGTLDAQITYDMGMMTTQVPFSATIGSLNELVYNQAFSARRIVFSTNFTNMFVPTMSLAITSIEILVGDTVQCAGSWSYQIVSHGCTIQVFNSDPLSITYRVESDWGTSIITGTTISTIPPIGGTTTLSKRLELPLTTLHLTGTVRNLAGNPVANVRVGMSESSVYEGSVYTNEQGIYSFYVMAHNDTITDTLDYAVSYQGSLVHEYTSIEYQFNQAQLNHITQDFTVDLSNGGGDNLAVTTRQPHKE